MRIIDEKLHASYEQYHLDLIFKDNFQWFAPLVAYNTQTQVLFPFKFPFDPFQSLRLEGPKEHSGYLIQMHP